MRAQVKTMPLLESAREAVEHLKTVSLFEEIKPYPGALEQIAEIMETRNYSPGDSIITEGEGGGEMYLLIAGEASVYKSTAEGDHYKVAILKGENHAFFGEGGLLDSDPRSATIKADTLCTCMVLERSRFESFGRKNPQWALPILSRIARAVMARLRKTNNDLLLLYNALVSEVRGE